MNEEDNKQDYSLFDKNYSNDPFREEFLIFDHGKDNSEHKTFKLNIEKRAKPKDENKPADPPQAKKSLSGKAKKTSKHKSAPSSEKRTIKEIFKDTGRQLLATLAILLLGFLILNWSAYYQIGKNKLSEWFGTKEDSPLEVFIEEEPEELTEEEELLLANNDNLEQSELIPPLDIEVSPITNRIIIPRIDKNVPVINVSSENLLTKDWGALEKEIQAALQNGVVHYPGTSIPGEGGNVVITGHSSYFPWDAGRFKDVFALLHDVVIGDKIVVYYNQDKYVYEVSEIKVVLPGDIEVLRQDIGDKLTLLTCTPVGTNLKRLIIVADPTDKNIKTVSNKVLR
ncbi:sortase [Candidatus Peregrinibacteria bacterium]|nr:sortase [Candidatus Peregrinibacteria bacterium]